LETRLEQRGQTALDLKSDSIFGDQMSTTPIPTNHTVDIAGNNKERDKRSICGEHRETERGREIMEWNGWT